MDKIYRETLKYGSCRRQINVDKRKVMAINGPGNLVNDKPNEYGIVKNNQTFRRKICNDGKNQTARIEGTMKWYNT